MAPLTYHRNWIAGAGGIIDRIRITNLGHARLRIINCQDQDDVAKITAEIISKNSADPSIETIAIFHGIQQAEPSVDVGWEGDIELGADQDLRICFHDQMWPASVGVTAGDILIATIGYEILG